MARLYNKTGNYSRPQPARLQLTGNLAELRGFRARLARLEHVHKEMLDLGYGTGARDIASEERQLRDTDFEVSLPCLLCRVPAPVIIAVAGGDEPGAVICETCSGRISLFIEASTGKPTSSEREDKSQ